MDLYLIIIVALSISVYPCNAGAEWASLLATEVCAAGKKQEESHRLANA